MSGGYFPPGYQPAPPSSLAPQTLAQQIDVAVASVPADRLGTFLATIDKSGFSTSVMIRIGGNVKVLGTLRKPSSSGWEPSLGVRVDFLVSDPQVIAIERIRWSDYYHALRTHREGFTRNGIVRAFIKATAVIWLGEQPYLDGARWFA